MKTRTLPSSLLTEAVREPDYNFEVSTPDETVFAHRRMDSNARSDGTEPVANSSLPPTDNPRGYPPFDLHRVPTYTNNQLRHYYISGATLGVDQAEFKRRLEERKTALEMVN